MTIGIILAAGRGTRLQSTDTNKTALAVSGKPLVAFGVELFQKTVDTTLIVIGAFADTVKAALKDYSDLLFVEQTQQLGTGHAAKVAVEYLESQNLQPDTVLLGYGDHMMFYTPEILDQMKKTHQESGAVVTMITVDVANPEELAWGRIVRNDAGEVEAIVEQKDATEEQRAITEQNAGFYCFDYQFLQEAVKQFEKSKVTSEYYITDVVEIARKAGKTVQAYTVPFEFVGSGVNTPEQLEQTAKMISK